MAVLPVVSSPDISFAHEKTSEVTHLRIGSWTLLTKELLRQRQSAEDFDQIVQLGADAAVFFDDIAVFFDDVAVDTGRRRLLDVGV